MQFIGLDTGTIYETLDQAGSGGSGIVDHAVDVESGDECVIKRGRASGTTHAFGKDIAFRDRFMGIDLPCCAAAIEAVRSADAPHTHGIVLPYVSGRCMHGARRVPWRAIDDILSALEPIHALGWYHGDIKPDNIMLSKRFGVTRGTLIDFGISGPAAVMPHFRGSLDYAAPEQAGGCMVGPAADIYGLGMAIHHCATGRTWRAELSDALEDERMQPTFLASPDLDGLPKPLQKLLSLMLSRNPANRPSAGQCRDYVADIISGGIS